MTPKNPILKTVHKVACFFPPLMECYRSVRDFSKRDPLTTALYRKLFDGGRLTLPTIAPEKLGPASDSIRLPVHYPLFAGEDAPLIDMLLLLNLAVGKTARRILEVGTYRARTTYALQINRPEAVIVSYDIQVLESEYRRRLSKEPKVSLRHASFSESGDALRQEEKFDFIFIDGSHQFVHVIEDSLLALDLVAPGGIILWHDYRPNDYSTEALRVPEALSILARAHAIHAVSNTTCAVYLKE
jgi:predicted O-methyltransferase YrrM